MRRVRAVRGDEGAGFTRALWFIRARLEDRETGESIDLRTYELAMRIGDALTRVDAGALHSESKIASRTGGVIALWETWERQDIVYSVL